MDFAARTYGAAADAKIGSTIGVTTSGLQTISDPSNPWAASDVGKTIWGVDQGGLDLVLPICTILTFTDGGHVTVSLPAVGSSTNTVFCWHSPPNDGTPDDTASLVRTYNAAGAGNAVHLGTGGYAVSGQFYRNNGLALPVALVGDERIGATIFVRPDFAFPGAGEGALIHSALGFGGRIESIGVTGLKHDFAGLGANQAFVDLGGQSSMLINRVALVDLGSSTADTLILHAHSCTEITANDLTVQGTGGGAVSIGMLLQDTDGTFADCITSNTFLNLKVLAHHGRQPVGAPLNWRGGIIDEGTDVPCQLVDAEIQITDALIYANANFAFSLDGTSKLWLDRCNVGRFLTSGLGGRCISMASGSEVFARANTFRSQNASPLVINNAAGSKFYDGGNNRYANWFTGAEVPVFWRNAFTNPDKVIRF